jgi:hypothetical protein
MMILNSLWQSLENSGLGTYIASSEWAFPTIETFHVIALVTVVGSIAIMDMRLLGLTSRNQTVTSLSQDTIPLTWGAFVLAAITGLLLFVSKATTYAANPYFQFKMVLLVLAGLNMAAFHLFTWRSVKDWDSDPAMIPGAAKLAGGLSLLFWVVIVFCGRTIGFTLGIIY